MTIAVIAALTTLTTDLKAKQAPEAEAPREAGEPIMAIVSIKSQRITFYDADGWIISAPVSTGTKGRETPAGVFAVLEKDVDHHSTLYDDASMPHMQRLTWNGIAFHGGPLPGYAASHGCVRMPYGFAEKLFDKTRIGMRVIISPNDATPVEFSHPALLHADRGGRSCGAECGRRRSRARRLRPPARSTGRRSPPRQRRARRLPPRRRCARRKDESPQPTPTSLPPKNRLAKAKSDEAKARAEEQKVKAAAKVAEAAAKLDTVKAEAMPKLDAAAKATDDAKDAAARKADTAKAANEAKLALEPVSIYISRAKQRLYVRRNTRKAWPDGGEVLRYDDRGSGRHPRPGPAHRHARVHGDGQQRGGLRWSAVTIENGDGAKEALDRVTIPQDVLDRIAPTAPAAVLDHRLGRTAEPRKPIIAPSSLPF